MSASRHWIWCAWSSRSTAWLRQSRFPCSPTLCPRRCTPPPGQARCQVRPICPRRAFSPPPSSCGWQALPSAWSESPRTCPPSRRRLRARRAWRGYICFPKPSFPLSGRSKRFRTLPSQRCCACAAPPPRTARPLPSQVYPFRRTGCCPPPEYCRFRLSACGRRKRRPWWIRRRPLRCTRTRIRTCPTGRAPGCGGSPPFLSPRRLPTG